MANVIVAIENYHNPTLAPKCLHGLSLEKFWFASDRKLEETIVVYPNGPQLW